MMICAVFPGYIFLILGRDPRAALQAQIGRIRLAGAVVAVVIIRIAVAVEDHDRAGLQRFGNIVDRRVCRLIDGAGPAERGSD